MWATKSDLNLKDVQCNNFIENEGVLIFNKEGLSNIQNKIDVADTQFLQVGKKVYDISGYTTGIGVGVKDVFKMMKKKNAFKFKSDFCLPIESDCLKIISNDIMEIFPYDILDNIESKLFFCVENIDDENIEVRTPTRFNESKVTKKMAVRIYFIKTY